MNRQVLILLPIMLLGLFWSGFAAAQNEQPPAHVRLTVTPEFNTVKPGDTFFVAIRQDLDEGWHTYWRNAGDSGEPPHFKWDLPAGFEDHGIYWPVPERIDTGPLTNYGYKHEVTLLQEFRAPDPLPEGKLVFSADADILVCEDICIPEYHEISFTLNDPAANPEAEPQSEIIDTAFNAMPVNVAWPATYMTDAKGNFIVDLTVEIPGALVNPNQRMRFDILPFEWGIIDNPSKAGVMALQDFHRLILQKPRGDRPLENLGELHMLVTTEDMDTGKRAAIEIKAQPNPEWLKISERAPAATGKTAAAANAPQPQTGFGFAILLALLGGLILNLMPCVFPILSMKALGLVKMTEKSHNLARAHGIAYTGGILLSFAALALILMGLKAGGAQIGWGFQLQNPFVVLTLCWLLFALSLNLSGFFEIGGGLANLGAKLGPGHGIAGSFLTGVLATIVATPCTAPFMAVALGYALTQPPAAALPVFLALGFGLALPYLLLSLFPALRAILPKPGPWMQTFRKILAFPMFASALWLIWVYWQQTGTPGLLYAACGFIAIAFAVWMFRSAPASGRGRLLMRGTALIILASVLLAGLCDSLKPHRLPPAAIAENAWYEPFTAARYAELQAGDAPLFVNMTAAWCITCKVNERTALSGETIRKTFDSEKVSYLKGDWTNQNPEITAYLQKYGRSGVPLYVFYGARDTQTGKRPEPVVLPQILTTGIIQTAIKGE